MIPEPLIAAVLFVFGACIGSFLNVCIYRLPLSLSIVSPPSACTQCKRPIAAWDNIPIISYLVLLGRCRHCRMPISMRYPLVELITGLSAAAVSINFGLTAESLVYFVFIAALIVVIFIDIDYQIIPDAISLPGIPLFFLASVFIVRTPVTDSLLGILAGGGSLLAVAVIYRLITGKEGMGGGDIKLLAMIGALCGWQGVLFTVFTSSLAGTVVGMVIMAIQKKNMKLALPFGPFLSMGAIVYLFFGPELVAWYLNMLRP
ncbi:MAG: prepilin peptidase [Thermodesulfobacteriota bacterium]|nr:prepilin peptidase [Thermodesulfobacteriota bacterium]